MGLIYYWPEDDDIEDLPEEDECPPPDPFTVYKEWKEDNQ